MNPDTNPASDPYLQAQAPATGGGKGWMIAAIILLLLLIAAGAYGYIQITNLNKELSSKSSEISALNNKVTDLETANKALEEKSNSTANISDAQAIKTALNNYCAAEVDATTKKPEVFKIGTQATILFATNKAAASVGGACVASSSTAITEPETFILKKANNAWLVVFVGEDPAEEIIAQFGLPASYPDSATF